MKSVSVIGGGLAGCEAAYVIAESGIHVNLFEMKPGKHSPAHKTDDLCELVCSNSLRSDKLDNAVGLLKEELRRSNSLPCIRVCFAANRAVLRLFWAFCAVIVGCPVCIRQTNFLPVL